MTNRFSYRRPGCRGFSAGAAMLLLAACGPGDDNGSLTTCAAALLPGDLVITEIMANPKGDDSGGEWIELYNASSSAVSLRGLVLAASRVDGTSEKTHVMAESVIEPGEYMVLGGVLDELRPGYVDYGYGSDLGSLLNTSGRIAARCDVIEVDAATYADMADGVAQGLSRAIAPDYLANDTRDNWCESAAEFIPGSFGTPGMATDCTTAAIDGTCDDGGTQRPTVPPMPGDLVITEILPDPAAVADAGGEWFEVYVARDVDMNGLVAGRDPASPSLVINDSACLVASAGSYLEFGRSTDPVVNGNLPAVDYIFTFGLANSGGTLFIGAGGMDGAVLDQITWASARSGRSISLDPSRLDTTANDDAGSFCSGSLPYGDGDLGTPGEPNPLCFVPEGMCDDAGQLRMLVPPVPGQVRISEYMANPAVLGDTTAEWFELRVDADVDLNGLELGRAVGTTLLQLTAVECLHATAGARLLFARSADPALNGGLPAPYRTFGFSLLNSNSGIFAAIGGQVLDSATYTTSTAGFSASLDEADNLTYCLASAEDMYADMNFGTPAAANPACPQP